MFTTARLLVLGFSLAASCPVAMRGWAQEKTSKISPSRLFTGDLARIEPHFGLAGSGCVKLAFDGTKGLYVGLQVWKQGKATTAFSGSRSPALAGEVSISVREAAYKGKMMYKVIVAIPGSTQTGWVDIPAGLKAMSSSSLVGEKAVQDGSLLAVWALYGNKSGSISSLNETLEQRAKRMDWAIVLTLRLSEKR